MEKINWPRVIMQICIRAGFAISIYWAVTGQELLAIGTLYGMFVGALAFIP